MGGQFSHVDREPCHISGSDIQLNVISVDRATKTVDSNTQDYNVYQLPARTRQMSPQPSSSGISSSVTSVRSQTSTETNIDNSSGISVETLAKYSNIMQKTNT